MKIIKERVYNLLDGNQAKEQAGFRKGFPHISSTNPIDGGVGTRGCTCGFPIVTRGLRKRGDGFRKDMKHVKNKVFSS